MSDQEIAPLTSRQRHHGTGDVLKDLAHAQRMTDTSEPGFGEVVCRGRELDFVNRAIRVAMGEIVQLRAREGWRPIAELPDKGDFLFTSPGKRRPDCLSAAAARDFIRGGARITLFHALPAGPQEG